MLLVLILLIILFYYLNRLQINHFDNLENCNDVYIFKTPQKYLINNSKLNILMIAGTHGNENSGVIGLLKFIQNIKKNKYKLPFNSLTIIPKVNKCGYKINSRYTVNNKCEDINRCYPSNNDTYIKNKITDTIIKYVKKSDIILDFHDGWGFYNQNSGSIGSTISKINNKYVSLFNDIINNLNKNILDNNKKFSFLDYQDYKINGSLGQYCIDLNKTYFLIETSGQNNVLDINTRLIQFNTIINYFCNNIRKN